MKNNTTKIIAGLVALIVIGFGIWFVVGRAPSGDQAANGERIYIPIISKGFQHQFWIAVRQGAEQAAEEYGVEITFEGPETEAMVDKQIEMLSAALARNPDAIGFAALDSLAAIPLLETAQERGIPVIEYVGAVLHPESLSFYTCIARI